MLLIFSLFFSWVICYSTIYLLTFSLGLFYYYSLSFHNFTDYYCYYYCCCCCLLILLLLLTSILQVILLQTLIVFLFHFTFHIDKKWCHCLLKLCFLLKQLLLIILYTRCHTLSIGTDPNFSFLAPTAIFSILIFNIFLLCIVATVFSVTTFLFAAAAARVATPLLTLPPQPLPQWLLSCRVYPLNWQQQLPDCRKNLWKKQNKTQKQRLIRNK